jgi:hypothetical protein
VLRVRDRLFDNGQRSVGDGVGWRLREPPDWPDAKEVVNVKRAEDEN